MHLKKEDLVIAEFLKSLGPWYKSIVIGGGYALIIYKLYLTEHKLGSPPVGTRDIDSLIPRKVSTVSKKNIAQHLHEAKFAHVFKDLDQPATEACTKEIDGLEVEIEFLTDSSTRGDKNKNVSIAGIVAQPLSYLTMSIQTNVEFQTFSKQTGIVVSPGAWMFHKGLTFTKRKTVSKTLKDLYGIWYVATQLGNFSEQALEELQLLRQEHQKWSKTFQENLHHWLDNASPIEWSKLEAQDPFGKLKKLNFLKIMKNILQTD